MWRSIAEVVFGYLITIFELAIPGFKQMATPPDFYFGVSIVTDASLPWADGYTPP